MTAKSVKAWGWTTCLTLFEAVTSLLAPETAVVTCIPIFIPYIHVLLQWSLAGFACYTLVLSVNSYESQL